MPRHLAGWLTIAMAVMLIAISVTHVRSPEEQRLSAGPEVMWRALVDDRSWSQTLATQWLLAGLIGLAVVPTATEVS